MRSIKRDGFKKKKISLSSLMNSIEKENSDSHSQDTNKEIFKSFDLKQIFEDLLKQRGIPVQEENVMETMKNVFKLSSKIHEFERNVNLHLLKFHWISNAEFDIEQQIEIMEKCNNQEETDKYFIELYDVDSLLAMFEIWKQHEIAEKRLNILEKCVNAYIKGDYELLIPCMFAQIEGLITDIFRHEGKYNQSKLENYIKQLNSPKGNSYDRQVKSFYTKVVLSSYTYGIGSDGEYLSRHAIMHGYKVDYGTQANALKVILLFDYIFRTLYYMSEPDD